MATDNVPITAGAGTNIRTYADSSSNEWQATVVSYATTVSPGANVLQPVMPAYPLPVTIAAAQVVTLTPPAAITGFALETGGNLALLEAKDFATQTTLAAASAKLPATLGQATMAASMAVVIASDQSTIPVTGTFYQATQPVSGTFWQATQPVSGTVALTSGTSVIGHVVVDSMPSTPVTGTFWQATQPISGSVSIGGSLPAGTNVIGHTIVDSGSIALAAGTALVGHVAIDQTTPGASNAVSPTPIRVTYTDRSGTIAAGGTAQTLAAINVNRNGFVVQNLSTGDLWINFTTAATAGQPSFQVTPGSEASFGIPTEVSTELISIYGATTGQAFTAKEY